MTVEQIQSPWIQLGGRPDRGVDPFAAFLPFAVAFFAHYRAAVLSFAIVAELERNGRRSVALGKTRRRSREKGANGEHSTVPRQQRLLWPHFRVADLWARAILAHPIQTLAQYVAKKGRED